MRVLRFGGWQLRVLRVCLFSGSEINSEFERRRLLRDRHVYDGSSGICVYVDMRGYYVW